MSEPAYFDQTGETSAEPGRWVSVAELEPLLPMPGLEFRPIATESVMANFVTFEPDAPAPIHHHFEQQIVVMLSGVLHFTVGGEERAMQAGDCVVIPPHVPHGGHAGPEGCRLIDVFTPPREGIVRMMEA